MVDAGFHGCIHVRSHVHLVCFTLELHLLLFFSLLLIEYSDASSAADQQHDLAGQQGMAGSSHAGQSCDLLPPGLPTPPGRRVRYDP